MKPTFLLILFSSLCYTFLFKANAEGVFQVKLLRFTNEQCSAPCQIKFYICLAHYQSRITSSERCVFGNATVEVNSFYPSKNETLHHKLVQFFFPGWHGYFSLIIDVLEKSNLVSNKTINSPKYTLLSRASKSEEIRSAKSSAERWRAATFRDDAGLQLQYAYRVLCTNSTFGPYCTKFCHPRNDAFGHYACDDNGERVCLPGWTNRSEDSYCTEAICSSGCNETNGRCVAPDVCRCKHGGWTGVDCSQCQVFPGCAKGSCSKPYECKCDYGWGGRFCNIDLHYCARNKPCYNRGYCRNAGYRSYTCDCKPGFTGRNCEIEIDECRSNPCQNGGVCVDLKNGYYCKCLKDLYGRNCEKFKLTCSNDNPCLNRGTCIGISNNLSCLCPDEFTGNFCQTPVHLCKDVVTCQNGGTCMEWKNTSHACFCARCACSGFFIGKMCKTLDLAYDENQKSKSNLKTLKDSSTLSTSQWIVLCVGSVALVGVLMTVVTCVLIRKRKSFAFTRFLRKKQTRDNRSDENSASTRVYRKPLKRSSLVDADFESLNIRATTKNFSKHPRKNTSNNTSNTLRRSENRFHEILDLSEGDRRSCCFELHSNCTDEPQLHGSVDLPTYEEACLEANVLLHNERSPFRNNCIPRMSSSI